MLSKSPYEHPEYDIGDLALYATFANLSDVDHKYDDFVKTCENSCSSKSYPMPNPIDQVMCKLVIKNDREIKTCRLSELPENEKIKAKSLFENMFQRNAFPFPLYDAKQSLIYHLHPKAIEMLESYVMVSANDINNYWKKEMKIKEQARLESLEEELTVATEIQHYPSTSSLTRPSIDASRLTKTEIEQIFQKSPIEKPW